MPSHEPPSPPQEIDTPPVAKAGAPRTPKPTNGLPPRPFRLLHLMLLIAAVALTLFVAPKLMRAIMTAYGPTSSWNRRMYVVGVTSIALVWWTLILAPLALVGNLGRLRRAARSYGAAAVFAAASSLCLLFAEHASDTLLQFANNGTAIGEAGLDLILQKLWQALEHAPEVSSSAIIAVWSILALTRAGRKPSNWLEILSLIFGAFWIAWFFVRPLVYYADLSWLHGDAPAW